MPCSQSRNEVTISELRTVNAKLVFLGGGTLGSTEIMLRSKEKGLSLSAQVGQHYSGNGDSLGFSYDTDKECHTIGYGGGYNPEDQIPVGRKPLLLWLMATELKPVLKVSTPCRHVSH